MIGQQLGLLLGFDTWTEVVPLGLAMLGLLLAAYYFRDLD